MTDKDDSVTVPTEQTDEGSPRLADRLTDPPIPFICPHEELSKVDFSRLDVLIGTVRNDARFGYCMEARAYYIPAKTVTTDELPVSAIALYEEGIGRKPGIQRYGRVLETRVVKRAEIPVPMNRNNPEEAYYLFSVASWDHLEYPIAIQDTGRGKPMFTNEFLLTHCRRSYQLVAIRSPEAYNLCRLLCCLAAEVMVGAIFRRVGQNHVITMTEGRVRILSAKGECLYTCSERQLKETPADVLRGAARALGL